MDNNMSNVNMLLIVNTTIMKLYLHWLWFMHRTIVIICWLNVNLHNTFTFYSYVMLFLDSELIGFTMMCFSSCFSLLGAEKSLYFTTLKLISNRKLDPAIVLRRTNFQKSKFPILFKTIEKTKTKIWKNRNIYERHQFDFGFYW